MVAFYDFILKSPDNQFVRLIYLPYDGFDAPPLKPEEMLPKQKMFSDGNLLWSFKVHEPRKDYEVDACKSDPISLADDEYGNLVRVNRYHFVPGREMELPPNIDKLPCLLIDEWKQIEK